MADIRHYSLIDQLCLGIDQALRSVFNHPNTSGRAYPAEDVPMLPQENASQQRSASIMRINHAGEICAQALYHGQGLVSRSQKIQDKMQQAAIEEGDHLAWCHQRLMELGSHTSYLAPIWYAGSFAIGLMAGLMGDPWSLGFLAETEHQVVKHLEKQMHLLPEDDRRSHLILQQMQQDEKQHRDEAVRAGALSLPQSIKQAMQWVSGIMVKTTYWV